MSTADLIGKAVVLTGRNVPERNGQTGVVIEADGDTIRVRFDYDGGELDVTPEDVYERPADDPGES